MSEYNIRSLIRDGDYVCELQNVYSNSLLSGERVRVVQRRAFAITYNRYYRYHTAKEKFD